jgi:carbonic anhydrase/acetyltransferase-like protein (isoleucine patch superfamily)
MSDKYELTNETVAFCGTTLRRIRALRDIPIYGVKSGDLGGWIEREANLSHYGDAWVSDNACVYDRADVSDNALVAGEARVYGSAVIAGNAWISGSARITGNAVVTDSAEVYDSAKVCGSARIADNAKVCGSAKVGGYTVISGDAEISDNALVCDNSWVADDSKVSGSAKVSGCARIVGSTVITGNAEVRSAADYMVFKNSWSSGRWFTYTTSNKMWSVGCFYGTGAELIRKAYADSEWSGRCYEAIVRAAEAIEAAKGR